MVIPCFLGIYYQRSIAFLEESWKTVYTPSILVLEILFHISTVSWYGHSTFCKDNNNMLFGDKYHLLQKSTGVVPQYSGGIRYKYHVIFIPCY